MEVILKKDLKGLGHKNEIVTVKPGYGRNYLIPQGIAMVANETNKKVAAENMRQASHKLANIKAEAQEAANQLEQLSIEVSAKSGENGKIFGSVTASQLAEAIKEKGINIDRRDINFEKPVKELGSNEATIVLHKEVQYLLKFNVIAKT